MALKHSPSNPTTVVSSWLGSFANALQTKDPQAATDCFLLDGWLRESQIFCWDNRTLHGHNNIHKHVAEHLPGRSFANFRVDNRTFLSPRHSHVAPQREGIKSGFLFETAVQWGQGYVQLSEDKNGVWKATTVYMAATDIKGQEESGREVGIYGGHAVPWPVVLSTRRKQTEENPHALISHVGLMVAARFKQMNIPTLVIDAQPRVGDTWRNRYDSLVLHTPRMHDSFLYQRYPQNWPLHTPKDKLANWMEHYADAQDLTIWTSSRPVEDCHPTYDESTKRWTIIVDRSGQRVTLHPSHIVCCAGAVGPKTMPHVTNSAIFKGTIIHGSEYKTPETYRNKRVVVVGAGNTAGDICIDLSTCAEGITLVQRSESSLVPLEVITTHLADESLWPDDGSVPTEIGDFISASTPLHLIRSYYRAGGGGEFRKYAALYQGLREKGMIVNNGVDGGGVTFQLLERLGGPMMDVGCADLVLSGRVGVKHGVELAEVREESVVFTDGSEIPADAVIFATGYLPMYENLRRIFGDEISKRAGDIWGLDEEGEIKNIFRPTGHPGLWYGAGSFQAARYGSKQLAMLIKAKELELTEM